MHIYIYIVYTQIKSYNFNFPIPNFFPVPLRKIPLHQRN